MTGTLREALARIRENATAWHGPLIGTGHERALAVIAKWCDAALVGESESRKHQALGACWCGGRHPVRDAVNLNGLGWDAALAAVPADPHRCSNCEGVDPASCINNLAPADLHYLVLVAAEAAVLGAVEDDARHGNLAGRTEDAWYALEAARRADVPPESEPHRVCTFDMEEGVRCACPPDESCEAADVPAVGDRDDHEPQSCLVCGHVRPFAVWHGPSGVGVCVICKAAVAARAGASYHGELIRRFDEQLLRAEAAVSDLDEVVRLLAACVEAQPVDRCSELHQAPFREARAFLARAAAAADGGEKGDPNAA